MNNSFEKKPNKQSVVVFWGITASLLVVLACNAVTAREETSIATLSPTPLGGGQMIAFGVLTGELTNDIYLYDISLGKESRLTNIPDTFKHSYSFSPDGRQLVFASNFQSPDSWLYVIDIDGTNLKPLLKNEYRNWFPAWAPDGKQIAFASDQFGDSNIFIMDSNGANIKRITDFHSGEPSWSPDGQKIAFQSNCSGYYEIYTMEKDGSSVVQLTRGSADNMIPEWSPDGKWISFSSEQDGNSEIYIIDSAGNNLTNLTMNPAEGTYHSWSPDGLNVVFDSDRRGDYELYIVNITTRNGSKLPVNKSAFNPTWSH